MWNSGTLMNEIGDWRTNLIKKIDSLSLSLMLRPTVSRPVSLGIKHPSEAYDQIFISVWQLRVCWCGALSLTRGRVCHLQLLLTLASAVILGSESRGTRDHILLSQIRYFPFRKLIIRIKVIKYTQLLYGYVYYVCPFVWLAVCSHLKIPCGRLPPKVVWKFGLSAILIQNSLVYMTVSRLS
jgi:hypothetical protein